MRLLLHNNGYGRDIKQQEIVFALLNGKSMINRLKLLTIILLLCFTPSVFSLGLGEISTESALNEPLEARIELLNTGALSEQELIVEIGSPDDYRIAGVQRDYFHTGFVLEPQFAENGDRYISITSSAPVREPYLNFVVQVRWPQGKLLREYTLLLDLPLFTGRKEAQSVTQPEAVTPAPPPAAKSRPEPVSRPAPAPTSTGTIPKPSISGADYRVQNGDTLWSLAGRIAEATGVTRHQAMMSIRDLNPNAFVDGNPDSLQAGILIRVPDEMQSRQRSNQQAIAEFTALQQGRAVAATPISSSANNFREPSSESANSGRLTLSSNSALGTGGASSQGSQAEADLRGALSSENQTLKEELDRAAVENQDLRDRIASLEERLQLKDALAEIESNELASVQTAAEAAAEPVAPQVMESPDEDQAETAKTPAPPSPSVQEPEPQPGLMAQLIGFAPYIGAVIVIALIVVMLLMKRRKSKDEHDFLDDESDEDVQESDDIEDPAEKMQQTGVMDEAPDFDADGDLDEDDEGFESMDELFGASESDDESTLDEPEEPPEAAEEPAEEAPELDAVEDEDVEDIDLEAALEDLDEFADLDSFLDEDIEDFDLDSDEGLEDAEEALEDQQIEEASVEDEDMAIDVAEPAASEPDGDEFEIELPDADEDSNEMDFESVELPESEEEEPELDDGNAMDFDDEIELPEIEEEEELAPAGNEMEFDSEDIELPEVEEEEPELDDGNAMDFDDEIELPEIEEEEELSPAGNEMEFDSEDIELPEIEAADDSELDEGNAMEFDIDDLELPEPESELPDEEDLVVEEAEVDLEIDDELDLPLEEPEDDLADLGAELETDLESDLEEDLEADMDELLAGLDDEVSEVNADDLDLDDSDDDEDLGIDLDEDLLADFDDDSDSAGDLSEEMSTKLELADAYIEMGDMRGARELIDEIMADGDDSQKEAAAKLAERM